eukprot:g1499.t1
MGQDRRGKKPNMHRHTYLELVAAHRPPLAEVYDNLAELLDGIHLMNEPKLRAEQVQLEQNMDTLRRASWMDWAQPLLAELRGVFAEMQPLVEGLGQDYKSRVEDEVLRLATRAAALSTAVIEAEQLEHCPAMSLEDPQCVAFWSEQIGPTRSVGFALFEECLALSLEEAKLWAAALGPFAQRNVAKAVRASIEGAHLCSSPGEVAMDELAQWAGQVAGKAVPGRTLGDAVGELCLWDMREGLAELFSRCRGPEWARRDGWLRGGPVQRWYGIACDPEHGALLSLSLPSNGLATAAERGAAARAVASGAGGPGGGAVPASVVASSFPTYCFQFLSLTRVDLSGNALEGALPAELGSARMAPRIRELSIGCNRFGGRLPPPLATSPTLQALYASDNQLAGELPREWHAPQLLHLHLQGNNLSGTLPDLHRLRSLQSLRLGRNRLRGELPASLGGCAALRNLQLERNQLEGEPPAALAQLTSLRHLDLGGNKLRGTFPLEGLRRRCHMLRVAVVRPNGFRVHVMRAVEEWVACLRGVPCDEQGFARSAAATAAAAAAAAQAATATARAATACQASVTKAEARVKAKLSVKLKLGAAKQALTAVRRLSQGFMPTRIERRRASKVGPEDAS